MDTLKPIILTVNPQVVKEFEKHAKEDFPNETLAYLLGSSKNYTLTLDALYWPSRGTVEANNNSIYIDEDEDQRAKNRATELGLTLIGDIHTHPWEYWQLQLNKAVLCLDVAHHPSETDWNERHGLDWITGVTLIREVKKGKLKISTRFWGPSIPVEVKYDKP